MRFARRASGDCLAFLPADALAALMAVSGLLALAAGAVVSVLARRFEELEGKVDMVTTAGPIEDNRDD